MSTTWYPVIDPEKCTGCLACYNKCKHGVYSLDDSKPIVVYPEGCVTGCHGCGNLCPEKAITYFGEAKEIKFCNSSGSKS
jgi:NAD-dependent dihydropyrimidine dehydrogenase PreA subunit